MFDLLVNLIEAFIISMFYTHSIHVKKKYTREMGVLLLFFHTFILTNIMNNIVYFEGMSTFIYVVLDVLAMYVLSTDPIMNLILLSLINNIFTSVSVQTSLVVISLFSHLKISTIFLSEFYLMLATILSKIIFASLCLIMVVYVNKKVNDLLTEYSKFFIALFTILFAVILFFQNAIFQAEYNYGNLVISSYLLLILTIMLIWLICKIKEDDIHKMNLNILEHEMVRMKEQFSLYENSNEEIAILRHDIKNILLVIDNYLKHGENEQARKYLEEKIGIINENKALVITENIAVDCVLNSFYSTIKEKKVEFITNIDRSCLAMMDSLDLAVILANTISNALENISLIKPFLEITIYKRNNFVFFKISNSVDYNVFEENTELKTTKNESKYHGFGIKSIINIVNQYNGTADFSQSEDLFNCRIKIPV